MSECRKVAVAFALSVLVHVSLFAALALMPAVAPVPAAPVTEEKQPLEVIVEAAPAEEALVEEPLQAQAEALRTNLDPENLKKADKAPGQPQTIAAHDSQATPPKPAPTPPPPDVPAILAPAPTPAGSPQPATEEQGIDAMGHYGKAVGNAIGARWEFHRKAHKDLPAGEVRLKFVIDAEGRAGEVQVLSNTAAPANVSMAIRAVKEAKIPPIPRERLAQVAGGRMEITYSFINYPAP